jgi:alpha-1,2-mannosyltransferase
MLGRPHIALVAAVVGIGISAFRRSPAPALRIAVPTMGALLFLLMWNHWMFGVWSVGGSYENAASAAAGSFSQGRWLGQLTNVAGFFFSPARGLLVWTPVLLLFLPALVRSSKCLPDWSRLLVVGGLLYSFFQMRLNGFTGGIGFYGYRHPLELVTCLVPALVFAVPKLGRSARLLVPVLLSAQVAAVTIGAINEAYFIYLNRMWSDNSFWVALRFQPDVVGVWTGLCLAVGVLVSLMINRALASASDYAETAPVAERP